MALRRGGDAIAGQGVGQAVGFAAGRPDHSVIIEPAARRAKLRTESRDLPSPTYLLGSPPTWLATAPVRYWRPRPQIGSSLVCAGWMTGRFVVPLEVCRGGVGVEGHFCGVVFSNQTEARVASAHRVGRPTVTSPGVTGIGPGG